jgi:hypothetical protein
MKTSPSSASEQRRPIFLRDWRVRSKLIAVLVIPAVAFLVLSSFGIGSLVRNAQAFEDGRRLADLGRQVTALVHELQAERDLSGALIESREAKVGEALDAQRQRVERAAADYKNAEAPLYDDLGDRLRSRFDAVRSDLDNLSALRGAIGQRSLSRRAVGDEYSRMIDHLLDLNGEIAQPGGDPDLAQSVSALNDCPGPRRSPPRFAGSCTRSPSAGSSSSAASRSSRACWPSSRRPSPPSRPTPATTSAPCSPALSRARRCSR